MNIEHPDSVLCYVMSNCAYFTTQALDKQWGDDWDDAPYEHNAGPPSEWHSRIDKDKERWHIIRVYFNAPYAAPCNSFYNSQYSVQSINAQLVPWLKHCTWGSTWGSDELPSIWAGTTLREFVRAIHAAEGDVYAPLPREE